MSSIVRTKKVLIGLMYVLFILILVACSDESGSSSNNASNNSEKSGTIKLGLSVPLSESAASWGITAEWVAKEAAKHINEQGGIEVKDKKYNFDVVAYDNKYNATDGAQVAQSLINKDEVSFVVSTIGSAPTTALQSISEPEKIIHFTTAWSSEIKGKEYPYTVTTLNSPLEVVEPLYTYILKENNDAESMAIINPNDATGTATADRTLDVMKEMNIEIVAEEYYERDTTEFSQIVTKVLNNDPDILDLGATPQVMQG